MLDAGSLSVLGSYFERLMGRIQERVDYVSYASWYGKIVRGILLLNSLQFS